ncbi:MAG: hypothetical protein Q9191_002897, partial [Dirinaria sp. TL-2023a]
MGSLPIEDSKVYTFIRPPLDAEESIDSRKGAKTNNSTIHTLLDLVDFNAVNNPDHVFCLQELKNKNDLHGLTCKDLADAVGKCTFRLMDEIVDQGRNANQKPDAVALLMASDVTLFIYLLALMRLDIPVALFSARLSPAAIAHLVEKIGVKSMIVTTHTSRSAKEASDIVEKKGLALVSLIESAPFEAFVNDEQPSSDCVPPQAPAIKKLDRNAIILHSSGSTGLPKPIYHAHRYLLNYATCHRFEPGEDTTRVCTSTLPLFHGFGMLPPALALSIGKTFALPSASTVPNAESTIRLLQKSASTSLVTVPMILEDICHAPDQAGIKALRPLDFVACGGGPMKSAVAEELSSNGVCLLNHCGATEIGALAPVFNPKPDYDWHYFVLRNDLNLRLEECPEKAGCVKLVGRAPGWDEDFIVQDFLEPNPKASTTQFRFLGRADDLIVLANGEKARTTGLEAIVASDPKITDAIAFGEGRDHLGLIVEAAPDVELDCSNNNQADSLREAIWPLVEKGNKESDSHVAVSKDMVIEASAVDRPLQRTAKGSLARKEIYDSFAAEIDAAYSKAETANIEPLPELQNTQEIDHYLRKAITNILGLSQEEAPMSIDEDIFELGMNSLQATRLHNMLTSALQKSGLDKRASSVMTKGFVYSHPTILSQRKALSSLASDHGVTNGVEPSRTEIMHEAVQRHCNTIAAMSTEPMKGDFHDLDSPDGKIVILTGSTGNLGSSLLSILAQDPSVSHIYCLNRPSPTPTDQTSRQHRAFAKAGICLPSHLWPKLHPLEAKPSSPNLGLSPELYTRLQQASYIIHNAWPMDFNRACASFEAQFTYLSSIIQLAIRSTGPAPPRILFTSSIASVAHYPSKTSQPLVPEIPMDDPEVTAPFGYPEAKWVCEQILLKAAAATQRFEPVVVRVGQLTGSTGAASWAATEHLPSVFRSAQVLGALPDLQG